MVMDSVDILDLLQAESGSVRLFLKSGETIVGRPDCIVYDEDEEGYDTIKQIRFEPHDSEFAMYYTEEEIRHYEPCGEGRTNGRSRKNPYRQFMAEVERGWKSAEEQGMTDIDEAEMLLGIKPERTEL